MSSSGAIRAGRAFVELFADNNGIADQNHRLDQRT